MCHACCVRTCAHNVVSVPVLCHFGTCALPANVRQRRGGAAYSCRVVVVR